MIAIRNSDGQRVVAREVLQEDEQLLPFLLGFNIDPTKVMAQEGDWIIVDLLAEPTEVTLISALEFLDDYSEEWSG